VATLVDPSINEPEAPAENITIKKKDGTVVKEAKSTYALSIEFEKWKAACTDWDTYLEGDQE